MSIADEIMQEMRITRQQTYNWYQMSCAFAIQLRLVKQIESPPYRLFVFIESSARQSRRILLGDSLLEKLRVAFENFGVQLEFVVVGEDNENVSICTEGEASEIHCCFILLG